MLKNVKDDKRPCEHESNALAFGMRRIGRFLSKGFVRA